jgi:hypothetical protein
LFAHRVTDGTLKFLFVHDHGWAVRFIEVQKICFPTRNTGTICLSPCGSAGLRALRASALTKRTMALSKEDRQRSQSCPRGGRAIVIHHAIAIDRRAALLRLSRAQGGDRIIETTAKCQ